MIKGGVEHGRAIFEVGTFHAARGRTDPAGDLGRKDYRSRGWGADPSLEEWPAVAKFEIMIIFRGHNKPFCLDRYAEQLLLGRERAGVAIHLPRKQWELLRYLAENHGKLVSKADLVAEVWKVAVSDDAISRAISGVRRALGDSDPDHPAFIKTVQGRGFRFIAEIEKIEPPVPPELPPASFIRVDTRGMGVESSTRIADSEQSVGDVCGDGALSTPSSTPASSSQPTDPFELAYLELWVADECTELRLCHTAGDVWTDTWEQLVGGLYINRYRAICEDRSPLNDAMSYIMKGLFDSIPRFQWNQRFRPGAWYSVHLPFALDPEAFAKPSQKRCTMKVYPFEIEIDLWTEGNPVDYVQHPLDSIGVDFEALGEGARRLAKIFGLRDATKACWPVVRMDNHERGRPYLHIALI